MEAGLPFRFRYHAHPLLRALAGLILGYWIANAVLSSYHTWGWIFILLSPALAILPWRKPSSRFPVLMLSWFLLGFGHQALRFPAIPRYEHGYQTGIIRLESTVKASTKGWKMRVQYRNRLWLVYGKGKLPEEAKPGQAWVALVRMMPVPQQALPGCFDFKKWLQRQGISGSLQLVKFKRLPESANRFHWKSFWGQLRDKFRSFLFENLSIRDTAFWVEALLLGQDDGLSESVQLSFRNTGTLHVLAISGLHIGLLYLVMDRLLSWLRLKEGLKRPILLLFLWSFSLLAELPESICRASLMYSLTMLARGKGRKMEGTHSLCGSALLILWWKPASLWSPGFLLSHAAVAGLLLIYPLFEQWIEARPRWARWLAEGFLLSIAAQLATLPFCFNMFGQFPTWFWIANLWAVPMSTVCLAASIIWIPLQAFPLTESLADIGLSWLIQLLCYPITFISKWPVAVVQLPPIPLLSLLGAIGGALLIVFKLKGYRPHFNAFIIALTLILFGFIHHHWLTRNLQTTHLSSTYKPRWVLLREGKTSVLLYKEKPTAKDSALLQEHFKWHPNSELQTIKILDKSAPGR